MKGSLKIQLKNIITSKLTSRKYDLKYETLQFLVKIDDITRVVYSVSDHATSTNYS